MDYRINAPVGEYGNIVVKGSAISADEILVIARKLNGLAHTEEAPTGNEGDTKGACGEAEVAHEDPPKFQVGDRVRIVKESTEFFHTGDIGVIIEASQDGVFFVDFNGHGNPQVEGDGRWWIGSDDAEVAPEAAPEVASEVAPHFYIKHTRSGIPEGVFGKQVRVFLREPGYGWDGQVKLAEKLDWSISGDPGDIIEYEVVE